MTDASGQPIADALAALRLQQYVNNQPVGAAVEAISPGTSARGNICNYEGSGAYHYNCRDLAATRRPRLEVLCCR